MTNEVILLCIYVIIGKHIQIYYSSYKIICHIKYTLLKLLVNKIYILIVTILRLL